MATGATAREIADMIDRGAERYSEGDVRSAAELWRHALELAPNDLRARAYLAWAEARLAADAGGAQPGAEADAIEADAIDANAIEVDVDVDVGESNAGEPVTMTRGFRDDDRARDRGALERDEEDVSLAAALADSDPTRLRGPSVRVEASSADDEPTDLFLVGAGDPGGWSVPPAVHTDPTRIAVDDDPALMLDNMFGDLDEPGPPPIASPPISSPPLASPPHDSAADDEELVIEMIAGEPDEPPPHEAPHPPLPPPRPQRRESTPQGRPATPARDHLTPVYEEVSHRWRIGPREDPLAAARVALERGDLEAAFVVAEKVVAKVSGIDSPELIKHQELLLEIYERHLGDCSRTVAVAAPPSDLHPRAAFLLSRVDGEMSIDDLRDVSGMPRLEATRMLAVLLRSGALVAVAV